jgi:hypothetical protein
MIGHSVQILEGHSPFDDPSMVGEVGVVIELDPISTRSGFLGQGVIVAFPLQRHLRPNWTHTISDFYFWHQISLVS